MRNWTTVAIRSLTWKCKFRNQLNLTVVPFYFLIPHSICERCSISRLAMRFLCWLPWPRILLDLFLIWPARMIIARIVPSCWRIFTPLQSVSLQSWQARRRSSLATSCGQGGQLLSHLLLAWSRNRIKSATFSRSIQLYEGFELLIQARTQKASKISNILLSPDGYCTRPVIG